jgi:hypothetical protein
VIRIASLLRRAAALAVVGVVAAGVVPLRSAAAQPAADPVARLLQTARTAFDDLEYGRAISICRLALSQASITRAQRVDALQLLAASQFPNDPDAARPDSAARTLRQLVKVDLDATFPRGLGWRGLDSLLVAVRGRTLAIVVSPGAEQQVRGGDGAWVLPYRATMAADVSLTAERNGVSVPLATLRGADGVLSVPALRDRAPVLANGEWALVVRARVPADSEEVRLTGTFSTDSLTFADMPAFDSTALKPERAAPIGTRAWLLGGLLGGATAVFASGLRAEDPVRSAYSPDPRAFGVAAVLAVGAGAAMFLDSGRALPENATANAALRAAFERQAAEVAADNERRLAAAVTTVRITR